MRTTDAQVRKLMEEMAKHGRLGLASARVGMDRKTARKYVKEGKFPSELKKERTWRTREDPFEEQWDSLAKRLKEAPELEAKTLFEELCAREPGRYKPGQLRTLQRRVREWRAQQGPQKQVFFAQEHRPGEAMQTDFTWANELEVTVEGQHFAHLLCHPVLPYSSSPHLPGARAFESYPLVGRQYGAALARGPGLVEPVEEIVKDEILGPSGRAQHPVDVHVRSCRRVAPRAGSGFPPTPGPAARGPGISAGAFDTS